MGDCKTISINDAITLAEKYGIRVAKATMIDWCDKHKLGHQPGGLGCQWYIFEDLFTDFISGKSTLDCRKDLVVKKRGKHGKNK